MIWRRGDKGPKVAELQQRLNAAGASLPRFLEVDGVFGLATELALRRFQEVYGLEVDGLAGPDTWAALELGADEAALALAPAGDLHPVFARRIDRSRRPRRRGILYQLGHGGWRPGDELPGRPGAIVLADRHSGCDCTGKIAWDFELARSTTIVRGLWGVSSVSLHRDGLTPGGPFRRIDRPAPGCVAVYPDRDGRQGHAGLVTQVAPTLRGVDCSSSRSRAVGQAITERGFNFFALNPATIWLVLESDPRIAGVEYL